MEVSILNWTLDSLSSDRAMVPPFDLRQKMSEIKALPPLPGMAKRIMVLSSDPYADAAKLASIIETDPILTTQVMRWASSALYGYKGKILTVQDAISRVLGYDYVFNLVLGLATLSPLKAPEDGMVGTKSFWTHALASSQLMEMINSRLVSDLKQDSQLVFFVAMMHNIGWPLMGNQFKQHFNELTRLRAANPELPQNKLEKFAFGVDHCELGYWLLNSWEMPEIVNEVVYQHHNPDYRGNYYIMNTLTYLNDALLAKIEVGDGNMEEDLSRLLDVLELKQEDCDAWLESIQEKLSSIQGLVAVCLNSD